MALGSSLQLLTPHSLPLSYGHCYRLEAEAAILREHSYQVGVEGHSDYIHINILYIYIL